MLTHKCFSEDDTYSIGYGRAMDDVQVYEKGEQIKSGIVAAGGEMFVSNDEYGSLVKLCPFCGKTGPQLLAERNAAKN